MHGDRNRPDHASIGWAADVEPIIRACRGKAAPHQDRVHWPHCVRALPYKTLADIEYATACWVDWYNHRRLHRSFGLVPPAGLEQAH